MSNEPSAAVVDTTTSSSGSSAARSAAASMAGQLGRIALQLLSLVILSRLLDVRSYGLVAAVTAVVGVGDVLRDLGLSAASIQARELTVRQRDNLFWTNVVVGAALTGATFFAAPLIAEFYHQEQLVTVCRTLSVTFLVNSAASQFRAGLTRELKFGRLAIADVTSQAVALGAATGLALVTSDFWPLVAQQIIAAGVMLVLVAMASGWRPGRPSRHASIRSLIGFGATLTLTQLIGYASRNTDSLIIGSRFGPVPLGLYNRGFQLLSLPLNQINGPATLVALPYLSRLRDQPRQFAHFLARSQSALLQPIIAVFAFSVAFAPPLVDVVLGPRWHESADVFRILAVAGPFQAAGYVSYWVFLAHGLTRRNLAYSLTCRAGLIGLLFVGAHWGVLGVAAAYSVGTAVMWPIGVAWIKNVPGVEAWAIASGVLRLVVGYGLSVAVGWLAVEALPRTGSVLQLLVGVLASTCALSVTAVLWPTFRAEVLLLLGHGRAVLSRPGRRRQLRPRGTQ